jgi:hypothetical protein
MASKIAKSAVSRMPVELWTAVFDELYYPLYESVKPLLLVCRGWRVSLEGSGLSDL